MLVADSDDFDVYVKLTFNLLYWKGHILDFKLRNAFCYIKHNRPFRPKESSDPINGGSEQLIYYPHLLPSEP